MYDKANTEMNELLKQFSVCCNVSNLVFGRNDLDYFCWCNNCKQYQIEETMPELLAVWNGVCKGFAVPVKELLPMELLSF